MGWVSLRGVALSRYRRRWVRVYVATVNVELRRCERRTYCCGNLVEETNDLISTTIYT